MPELNVLFEDNHLLVVEKPPNIPVQADSSGDEDLLTVAKNYIKNKYAKPGEVYLGIVHRLDRPVGGILVFARTSKAAKRLSDQWRERSPKKQYLAVAEGSAADKATLKDFLLKDQAANRSNIVREGTAGAKSAVLDYEKLGESDGRSLLLITLHTGRSHQIRVQLQNAGYPLWGDQRYNPKAQVGQQIALWAYLLEFEHPTRKEILRFTSMPQSKGVWKDFILELAALKEDLICGVSISKPIKRSGSQNWPLRPG